MVDRFMPARDHPYEGMSHPVAQCAARCNVDVKCLLRAVAAPPDDVLTEIQQEQQEAEVAKANTTTAKADLLTEPTNIVGRSIS